MVWNDLRDTVARVNRWDTGQRVLRLRLLVGNGSFEKAVDDVLLVQSADIVESLNDGVRGHLTCLGLRDDLPLEAFVGLPVEVQMATDTGDLRLVRGLVERALRGHLDGSLTVYQLRLVDPLAFLRGRESSTFIANDASVIEVTDELLRHLQIESPAFGTTFAWTWGVGGRATGQGAADGSEQGLVPRPRRRHGPPAVVGIAPRRAGVPAGVLEVTGR